MTGTAKKFARSTAGSAMIELAVTLPLLLIFAVGVTDFGRYAYASIEISNAAHAGAMYAAQNHITACDHSGVVKAATIDASEIVGASATASGSSTSCSANSLCACSNNTLSLSSCSTISCGSNRVIQYVKVTTTATVHPIFNYPGFPSTLTLKGQAIMRTQQ